jgi:hypothetical protein
MENKDIKLYDIYIKYSYSRFKELFENTKKKEENKLKLYMNSMPTYKNFP